MLFYRNRNGEIGVTFFACLPGSVGEEFRNFFKYMIQDIVTHIQSGFYIHKKMSKMFILIRYTNITTFPSTSIEKVYINVNSIKYGQNNSLFFQNTKTVDLILKSSGVVQS